MKTIKDDELTVRWYRESYISSTKAFVSVEKNYFDKVILDCEDGFITGVSIVKDAIKIKFYGSSRLINSYTPKIDKYHVMIDSSVTFDEWNRYYHPTVTY
ncbi:hypothetical protein [Mucilaginibacter antarcticus]|uniref:Uncharacterized protein n=1 Tax=Mucilaginibacter antarcticus TaxID=1855725 RepID=A0ABW5XLM9_9SPHI